MTNHFAPCLLYSILILLLDLLNEVFQIEVKSKKKKKGKLKSKGSKGMLKGVQWLREVHPRLTQSAVARILILV